MLMLLNMHQAVMLCLFWSKKISDPFESDTNTRVFEDPGLKFSYFITQWALPNGIESDELPALKKPKNKGSSESRVVGTISCIRKGRQTPTFRASSREIKSLVISSEARNLNPHKGPLLA